MDVCTGISFLQSLSHLFYVHDMIFTKLSCTLQEAKGAFKDLAGLLFLNLILYFFLRLFFGIWNYGQLNSLSAAEWLLAGRTGMLFDLAIVGPICALMMISTFLAPRILRILMITILLGAHTVLILFSIADSVFINFMGRRFTVNTVYLIGEGRTSNLFEYYQLFIFAGITLAGYYYITFKILEKKKPQDSKTLTKIFLTFIFLSLAVISGRGGFQSKPISFINAKVINHPFAHQLILNSGFTFIKSIGRDQVERLHYFEDQAMLQLLNLKPDLFAKTSLSPQSLNVVLIMVESLSSEYLSPRITPFLTELSEKGVLFNPAYANGRRSVEGVAAVLSGIPSLMEESFINSEFATNDFVGLGTLLKTKGYETSFFHGAQNGSMRFDSFTRAAGFDHYFGKNEFGDNTQDDGAWGIFDEPFLQFTCDQIGRFNTPFATVIFTLTSHVPYHLPLDFKQKINAGDLKNEVPMLKSIHYTDQALKNFFECSKDKSWFNQTLFIIMADHTGPGLKADGSFRSNFEIPILFYSPDRKRLQGLSNQQLAQQIDILPTLTDLMGISLLNKNHLARSLFEPGQKVIPLFSDQRYELVTDMDQTKNDDRLKAVRQYFSEGLYDNRLYYPKGVGH